MNQPTPRKKQAAINRAKRVAEKKTFQRKMKSFFGGKKGK